MARETQKGAFAPKNPKKYAGNSSNIVYRSSWERVLMERFDSNENILYWASEEIKIPYVSPVDNDWHTYYPDFLVKQKKKSGINENVLIEVKPLHEIIKPVKKPKQKVTTWNDSVRKWVVNRAKWLAAMEWCKRHNTRF
jgi:hypothetical protein